MRARRLRPSFDVLSQRITPSDITPLGAPVAGTANDTTIISGLDPWVVTGTPQDDPTNVLHPTVDPTQCDGIAA